jgi:hypothetical protein
MKKIVCLMTLAPFLHPAIAGQLSSDEILAKTHRIQKAPKSKGEFEGVTLWCIDSLMVPVLHDAIKIETRAWRS